MTDTYLMPRSFFCSLEDVKVSSEALALAYDFDETARSIDSQRKWIVCFDWGDIRRRKKKDNPNDWEDLGAGLDLVAFEDGQVPDDVVQAIGGFQFALKIPRHILAQLKKRVIDVNESKNLILS